MKLRHFAVFGGIFTVIICLLLFLFIVTSDDEESGSSSLDFSGLNLSAEVLKHQSTVEKYAKEYRISDYVNYLLAIMQVESGGTGTTDVMQASESLGLPLNSLSVEDSIKQGCKYFSELLKSAEAKDCDINTVVQSYNYGGGFIDYVSKHGKKYTFELAVSFAKGKSGGVKVTYKNDISIKENGGWRYKYGNMFYVKLVSQYLAVPSLSDATAQAIFNEALKYQGWKYVYGGSNPNTSFDCFIAHQFPDFVASVTAPIVMVIILLAIDWRFGIASLVGIVLAFVVQFSGFGSGAMKENMGKYQIALEDMNNASVEYVRGMPVVKAFNQTASSFARLEHAIKEYTEWVLKFSLGWQNYMPAFTTIINNIYLVIVPVGILLGANAQDYKSFTMTFIFYLLFVPAIAGILNKIMYISESFMQIDGNVARMDEIFNIPVLPQTTSPKKTQKDDVVFDNVSFTYTGKKEEMAIENVSFKANQGQITAIVGLSGGGKSTIANLISRFWDVTEGSVKIGGVDIRDISEKDLMNHVSFVFQDIFLFKQSILDNIRMGNPNATEEQVIEAAKAAQCHEFISKLPNGYKTVFGTKGIHLSGGERQRIAIARAIIKDSPIIVLDEATAFSDPENEYLIQKAFEKLMQNKTVIIIAHRLSTIRNADKIIVMEKGHLVEEGKHNELVAAGGRYSQMWNHYTEAVDWKISGKAV